jgi:hypothetical protein
VDCHVRDYVETFLFKRQRHHVGHVQLDSVEDTFSGGIALSDLRAVARLVPPPPKVNAGGAAGGQVPRS